MGDITAKDLNHVRRRYLLSQELVRIGVELVVAPDRTGSDLNRLLRELTRILDTEPLGPFEPVVGALKSLRWKRLINPVAPADSEMVTDAVNAAHTEISRLLPAVSEHNKSLLTEVSEVVRAALGESSCSGDLLHRFLQEVGPTKTAVLLSNSKCRAEVSDWLQPMGVDAVTTSDMRRSQEFPELVYAIGPPIFFPPAVITAPTCGEIIFITADWFHTKDLPVSQFSETAEMPMQFPLRINSSEPQPEDIDDATTNEESSPDSVEDFMPNVNWDFPASSNRKPERDERMARRVLLSGGHGTWLDDGERIRSLDPEQPPSERVVSLPLSVVRSGTYLLLRDGETGLGAPLAAGIQLLGESGEQVLASQAVWKSALEGKLRELGHRQAERMVIELGIKAHGQLNSWVEESRIRPSSDHDFRVLLQWLGLQGSDCFEHATHLRRCLHRATSQIREHLEASVSSLDLDELRRAGHVIIQSTEDGFRDLVAARVLAISPDSTPIPINHLRRLEDDEGARWLE